MSSILTGWICNLPTLKIFFCFNCFIAADILCTRYLIMESVNLCSFKFKMWVTSSSNSYQKSFWWVCLILQYLITCDHGTNYLTSIIVYVHKIIVKKYLQHRNSKSTRCFQFHCVLYNLLCFIKHIIASCIKSFAACMGGGNGGIGECPYRFFIDRKGTRNTLYFVLPPSPPYFWAFHRLCSLISLPLGFVNRTFFENKLLSFK